MLNRLKVVGDDDISLAEAYRCIDAVCENTPQFDVGTSHRFEITFSPEKAYTVLLEVTDTHDIYTIKRREVYHAQQ